MSVQRFFGLFRLCPPHLFLAPGAQWTELHDTVLHRERKDADGIQVGTESEMRTKAGLLSWSSCSARGRGCPNC